MVRFVFFLGVATLLGVLPTRAATAPLPLLAVLELEAPESDLSPPELLLLTDTLRGAVVEEVGTRYKVLTRETMMELVPASQMKCFVDKCAADIGRMLQAPFVIAGNVRKLGKLIVLTIETYESMGGRLLGSKQLRVTTSEELFGRIETEMPKALRTWLRDEQAARPERSAPEQGRVGAGSDFSPTAVEQVLVTFESTPAGAVVMLDGELACRATPCTKAASVGDHQVSMSLERYEPVTRKVTVSKIAKKVAFDLPANFAVVEVNTTPSNLPVKLDGKAAGRSPLKLTVNLGQHELLIDDACWQPLGERFNAERGATRKVQLEAVPRWAGLKVSASDSEGNDVEANLEVDGQPSGQSPATLKLPVCAKTLTVTMGGLTERRALSLK